MVLIMDVRHPLTPLDRRMLDWFAPTGKAVHVILTKSDKLARQQAKKVLKEVETFLQESYPQCTTQLFSSLAREGIEEATSVLGGWLKSEQLDGSLDPAVSPSPITSPDKKIPRLKGNKAGGKLP
jgi:GTP-binding protein